MEKKYYLPISSTSLAHYFGCACIKPSKYFDNKPEDLQDKFKEFLLITTHFGMQQTNCCLEIIFTYKEEKDDLINIKNGFYLYEKPLPITRVKKIYFSNKEQKELTIADINMTDAFIPEGLVEVVDKFDKPLIDEIVIPADIHINHFEKSIQTFNSLLGGFALLKLAGIDNMNFSENYFASLSTYLNIDFALPNRGRQFTNLFNDSLYKKIKPFLREKIDENTVEKEAQREGQKFIKNKITQMIDLSKLTGLPFVLAILCLYGVGKESKRKKIGDLILTNFRSSEIKPDVSEITALCYGLNRGYSAFHNFYLTENNKKEVKFQLNSQLDYYTIESLYQYAFNNIRSDRFSYLDWCPRYQNTIQADETNYQILDVVVIGGKKVEVGSEEWFQNLYSLFVEKIKTNFWENGIKNSISELVKNVISDTRKESENKLTAKEEEINKLMAERKELLESQKNAPLKKYDLQEEKTTQIVAEPQVTYLTKQEKIKSLIEQLFKQNENDKFKTKAELKKEVEKKLNKKMKDESLKEIVLQLLNFKDLFG